jgi:CheY-like chemotaxis protein
LARKILLADDSVTAQNMGRKILADAGYEVITVNNGSAALKKIAEVKPDLIVLDVYMPGYSGLEVCQRLKEAGDTARIPVLLTVGKLEPFKPEEAKRVRAEGFIVKPFEASELLSALTKLEDKMVPRSESSKPGRFARTIAVVEEGRYDKTMAPDEDSGWKNRISFPTKKKGKAAEAENSDDSAIYNPVNKDLRTVVEQKPTQAPQEVKTAEAKASEPKEEKRVDVTALAPEGLPKDVTPEEIAALAAAAAQMQGKITEISTARTDNSEIKASEPPSAAAPVVSQESPKIEAKAEKIEALAETKNGEPAAIEAAATFAEQKSEEKKNEASAGKSGDDTPSGASIATPTSADVTAAIAALENDAPATASLSSSKESSERERHPEPEPVTMAIAAAAAAQSTAAPRWTAVAVALAPEESGIALEDEMRKAYAAYTATETSSAQVITSISQPSLEPAAPVQISVPVETAPPAAPPVTMPEIAPPASAMASVSMEEAGTRVKSFETIRASSIVEAQPAVSAEVPPEPSESMPSGREVDTAKSIEASTEESPVAEVAAPDSLGEEITSSPLAEQQKSEQPAPVKEDLDNEESTPVATASVEQAPAISTQAPEIVEAAVANEPAESSAAIESASLPEQTQENSHETPHLASNKESDIAATTAAAWASWRRIRESGDPKDAMQSPHKGKDEDQFSSLHDEAAMAVAAGAEKAPEEGPEIASIVDSVLADLRPKIVEEISKKLKKK